MAISGFEPQSDDVLAEINMTPLVDVMLVLLIIFIVTIPVINHAIKVDLPRASNQPNQVKPQHIDVSINAAGELYWNMDKLDEHALTQKLEIAAQQDPKPELHLRADRKIAYERVTKVMAASQRAGITKIGFITDIE